MGTRRTARCCSAVTLIAITSLTIAAQKPRKPDLTPLSLFPVRPLWTLALNNQLTVPPVYSGTHAYFAIEADRLVAYDLVSGHQEWIAKVHPQFEPAAGEGLLYVVESAALTALRTSDGTIAWQVPAIGEVAAPPVWDNGWLVLTTAEGELLAFRATDGHLVWRRILGSTAHTQPALAADRVYVPLDDGRIAAMRIETGDSVWERRLGGPATGLLALDDRLYVGSRDNYFYALETTDGRVDWRWRTGADVVGVPVVDERNVYFVSLDNVLRALSRKSGVQQWVRLLPLRPTRGPVKLDRTIVVSGVAPMLRAYNMKDGSPAGDLPAEGELAASPYALPNIPVLLPRLLFVTRDIAKGTIATLVTRRLEPAPTPMAPLPNILKPTTPPGPPRSGDALDTATAKQP